MSRTFTCDICGTHRWDTEDNCPVCVGRTKDILDYDYKFISADTPPKNTEAESFVVEIKNHRNEIAIYYKGEWDLSDTDGAGLEGDIIGWIPLSLVEKEFNR